MFHSLNGLALVAITCAAVPPAWPSGWSPPSRGDRPAANGANAGGACGPDAITCNQAVFADPDASVACVTQGDITRENHYFRHFIMADHDAPDEYQVECVTIGVSIAEAGPGAGGVQPATLNLYDVPPGGFPAPPPLPNLIASVDLEIADQSGTLIEVPVAAAGSSGGLVVEVMVPDAAIPGTGHSFYFGANSQPETCLSYVSAVNCGIVVPVPTAAIGFPNTHWVMTVGIAPPCPGDTNDDGTVNVDDIVNVILDWGTDGAGAGGDVDGNGVVNVDDLVLVVLNFGSC